MHPSSAPAPAASDTTWIDLLSDAGVLAVVVDPEGRVQVANQAFRDACGWGGAAPEDRRWPRDCPACHDTALVEAFERWSRGEAIRGPVETRLLDPTGAERHIRWHGAVLRGVEATVSGVALLGLDEGVEHRLDADCRRLQAFYRTLHELNELTAQVTNVQALLRAVCEIAVSSGTAAQAWIGLLEQHELRTIACAGAQDPAPWMLAGLPAPPALMAALARGERFVCQDLAGDARLPPWDAAALAQGSHALAAFPIRHAGRVAGVLGLCLREAAGFDALLVELAERMASDLGRAWTQIDLAGAHAAAEGLARERRSQLSELVESALDGIIAIDARHRIVLFNAAAVRMFGVPASQAIGGTLDRFLPEELREGHRALVARFAGEPAGSRQMGVARPLVALRASGEVFPIEASISRSGGGDDMLMTVMVRDATQMRLAEREQAARLEAEAASRAKTDFLSSMSHELRTPLSAVMGFSQLLADDPADPPSPSQRQRLQLVLEAGEHLRTLIDEMLDITGIEAGRVAIDARDFDLREVVDGVLRLSEPLAAKGGVRLQAEYGKDERVLAHGDPGRVRQVVLNLVSNAIKYSRRGGRVRVGIANRRDGVRIVVRDEGIGMSRRQMKQLYQPFNRLGREAGPVPGLGLGLALVRQLVKLLGGQISVESRSGEGTIVRVHLPAAHATPAPPQLRPAPSPEDDAQLQGRVLYVEDNPVNALLVSELMKRWPQVAFSIADDGASGLRMAAQLRPDVVLLDMQLPDMSGLEVLHALRSDEATRPITVVALSANALPADIGAAFAAGADDYWTKPIDFGRFVHGMRELLAR